MIPTSTVLAGRYELRDLLGRGGMAAVYRGTDRQLGREVAVKLLEPTNDRSAVARFRREARAAARLHHPNIVGVFDRGSDGDRHFIVMELVEGSSLRELLEDEGPLPVERARRIAAEVAEALAYAHRRGVVHRDVKPENVLLTREGSVKVADLGIAHGPELSTITATGAVFGSAAYVSPEQAAGRATEPSSDLYSLGIVLYEMLAGRPPFVGDSPVAVAMRHVEEAPPRVTDFRPDVPPDLQAAIERALAKAPDERFRDASEFARALVGGTDAPTMPVAAGEVAPADAEGAGSEETVDLGDRGTRRLDTGEAAAMGQGRHRAPRRRRSGWLLATALGVVALLGLATLTAADPAADARSGLADGPVEEAAARAAGLLVEGFRDGAIEAEPVEVIARRMGRALRAHDRGDPELALERVEGARRALAGAVEDGTASADLAARLDPALADVAEAIEAAIPEPVPEEPAEPEETEEPEDDGPNGKGKGNDKGEGGPPEHAEGGDD